MQQNLNLVLAFSAGLLAFFSPCFLPLVPAYLIFITGESFDELKTVRGKTIFSSLAFILGFSLVFILLGLTATVLGSFLYSLKDSVRVLGGVFIVFLGVYMLGIIKVPGLDVEKKLTLAHKPMGYLGAFFVGMTFAFGWSPCVGPILGGILVLASQAETVGQGVLLLIAFSLGLGLPLFLFALVVNFSLALLKKIQQYLGIIHKFCGVFLVIIGLLLLTDYFQRLIVFIIQLTGYRGI